MKTNKSIKKRMTCVEYQKILEPITKNLKSLENYSNYNIRELINEVFDIALKIDNSVNIFYDKHQYKGILVSLYEIASGAKIGKKMDGYIERAVYYNENIPRYKGTPLSELYIARTRSDHYHYGRKYIEYLLNKYGYGYNEELKEELIDTIEYLIPYNMCARYRSLVTYYLEQKEEEEAEKQIQEEFIDEYSARTILKVLKEGEEWE